MRYALITAALIGATAALGETNAVETAAVTNTWITSSPTNVKAWTRQAVMVRPDKTIIDPSGVFVGAAEAAVESNRVDRVAAVADAAKAGMREAISGLMAVTNQVPETAYHVAVATLPPTDPTSLMGLVVKEQTDGVTDTQWVWYSHRLSRKPVRRIVYVTPSGRISQDVTWVDWDADGETITAYGREWSGCHKCTFLRPSSAYGVSAVSRINEVFGNGNGFDFGSVAVTIGGQSAITTNIVGKTTGRVMSIKNGFFVSSNTKEAAE